MKTNKFSQLGKLGIVILLGFGATTNAAGNRVLAQITPDRTLGTESSVVTPLNPQVDRIDGGAIRGTNLFHSFQDFNIGEGRGAYFANPVGTENIFSRVTGTNPSRLFGTLGVLGNANLYFLNPNGVIFGPNAKLDIKGSFVGTTASSMTLPDGTKYSGINPEAPPLLINNVKAPIGLQFKTKQPGAIINSGKLAVGTGQNLTLVSGTVVSTGELSAPGGEVAVVTVPGLTTDSQISVVNLGQAGQLVGVEMQQLAAGSSQPATASLSLPELLTNTGYNTGLTVANSQVQLAGSNLPVVDGDVVVGGLTAQKATLSANHNLTLVESQLRTTGDMQLLAKDTVRVRDSAAKPFIASSGGQMLVQGNQGVDIFALNHPASGLFSGGNIILRSANTVGGDTHYQTGGNFQIEKLDGSLGNLFSPYDPIVLASGNVSLGDYTGASLHILAGGSVTLNNVTIIATDTGANTINPSNTNLFNGTSSFADLASFNLSNGMPVKIDGSNGINGRPTLDIRAGINWAALGGIPSPDPNVADSGAYLSTLPNTPPIYSSSPLTADIIVNGNITIHQPDGVVFLSNQYNPNTALPGGVIKVGNINTNSFFVSGNSGSVILDSRSDINTTGTINTVACFVCGNAGSVNAIAKGEFYLINNFIFADTYGSGRGGDINIEAKSFLLNAGLIQTITNGNGKGGSITINTSDSVKLIGNNSGLSTSPLASGDGGDITIKTGQFIVQDGALATTVVGSSSTGHAGNLTVKASDSVELSAPGNGKESGLYTGSIGGGNGGNLSIETERLVVRDGAQIVADNSIPGGGSGTGAPGSITVIAHQSVDVIGTSTTVLGADGRLKPSAIATFTVNSQDAGDLTIQTRQFTVRDGASISATTQNGTGRAGTIRIDASDSMEVIGSSIEGKGSRVRNATFGDGNGGNLIINAGQLFIKDGARIDTRTTSNGDSGTITINTNIVGASGGGQIIATTDGTGKGGKITVTATDRVMLSGVDNAYTNKKAQLGDPTLVNESPASGIVTKAKDNSTGRGGDIQIITPSLSLTDGAQLSANTSGKQDAGNININATDDINISGMNLTTGFSSGLFTNTNTQGKGGDINVKTNNFHIADGAVLNAQTGAIGNGGNITVNANYFEAVSGAQLTTTTTSIGSAGNIAVNTTDSLNLAGTASGLFANTAANSTGTGGSISVYSNQLNIRNSAGITVSSQGLGVAGNIKVLASSILLDNQGSITAQTLSTDGGNINLQVQDLLLMRYNSLISTTAGTAQAGGNGGNITINAPFIVGVPKENSDITANAFTGNGGRIAIYTQALIGLKYRSNLTPLSDITASSQFGLNGTVLINTPGIDPSRGLATLPSDPRSPKVNESCSATGGQAVQFFRRGRNGSLPKPEDPQSDDTFVANWINSGGENQAHTSNSGNTGAMIAVQGDRLILSCYAH